MTYVNPRSVTACGILFPILGAIAVALRFSVRHRRKIDMGADDWLCLPALVGIIKPCIEDEVLIKHREGSPVGRGRAPGRWSCSTLFRMALAFL